MGGVAHEEEWLIDSLNDVTHSTKEAMSFMPQSNGPLRNSQRAIDRRTVEVLSEQVFSLQQVIMQLKADHAHQMHNLMIQSHSLSTVRH